MKHPIIVGVGAVSVLVVLAAFVFFELHFAWQQEQLKKLQNVQLCNDVDGKARVFAKELLPGIITIARENRRLAPDAAILATQRVGMLKEGVSKCSRLEGMVPGTTIPFGEFFTPHEKLISLLDPYIALWQGKSPNDIPQGDAMLASIEELQRDLTGGSSGHPQAGATEPKR